MFLNGLLTPSLAAAGFKTFKLHPEPPGYWEIFNETGTDERRECAWDTKPEKTKTDKVWTCKLTIERPRPIGDLNHKPFCCEESVLTVLKSTWCLKHWLRKYILEEKYIDQPTTLKLLFFIFYYNCIYLFLTCCACLCCGVYAYRILTVIHISGIALLYSFSVILNFLIWIPLHK